MFVCVCLIECVWLLMVCVCTQKGDTHSTAHGREKQKTNDEKQHEDEDDKWRQEKGERNTKI